MAKAATFIGIKGSIANRPLGKQIRTNIVGLSDCLVYAGFPLQIPLDEIHAAVYSDEKQQRVVHEVAKNGGLYGYPSYNSDIHICAKVPNLPHTYAEITLNRNRVHDKFKQLLWPSPVNNESVADVYRRTNFYNTEVNDRLALWALQRSSAQTWQGKVRYAAMELTEKMFKERHLIALWPGIFPYLNRIKANKAHWKCKLGFNDVYKDMLLLSIKAKFDALSERGYLNEEQLTTFTNAFDPNTYLKEEFRPVTLAKLAKVFPRAYLLSQSVKQYGDDYCYSVSIKVHVFHQ